MNQYPSIAYIAGLLTVAYTIFGTFIEAQPTTSDTSDSNIIDPTQNPSIHIQTSDHSASLYTHIQTQTDRPTPPPTQTESHFLYDSDGDFIIRTAETTNNNPNRIVGIDNRQATYLIPLSTDQPDPTQQTYADLSFIHTHTPTNLDQSTYILIDPTWEETVTHEQYYTPPRAHTSEFGSDDFDYTYDEGDYTYGNEYIAQATVTTRSVLDWNSAIGREAPAIHTDYRNGQEHYSLYHPIDPVTYQDLPYDHRAWCESYTFEVTEDVQERNRIAAATQTNAQQWFEQYTDTHDLSLQELRVDAAAFDIAQTTHEPTEHWANLWTEGTELTVEEEEHEYTTTWGYQFQPWEFEKQTSVDWDDDWLDADWISDDFWTEIAETEEPLTEQERHYYVHHTRIVTNAEEERILHIEEEQQNFEYRVGLNPYPVELFGGEQSEPLLIAQQQRTAAWDRFVLEYLTPDFAEPTILQRPPPRQRETGIQIIEYEDRILDRSLFSQNVQLHFFEYQLDQTKSLSFEVTEDRYWSDEHRADNTRIYCLYLEQCLYDDLNREAKEAISAIGPIPEPENQGIVEYLSLPHPYNTDPRVGYSWTSTTHISQALVYSGAVSDYELFITLQEIYPDEHIPQHIITEIGIWIHTFYYSEEDAERERIAVRIETDYIAFVEQDRQDRRRYEAQIQLELINAEVDFEAETISIVSAQFNIHYTETFHCQCLWCVNGQIYCNFDDNTIFSEVFDIEQCLFYTETDTHVIYYQ